MSWKAVLAVLLGLGALGLGAWLLARETGAVGTRVHLADVTAASLDTTSVRGRRVEVSLGGVVTQIGPGEDVWLDTGRDAIALRFPGADAPPAIRLEVDDRLLAVGQLRAWRGRRWVDVASWVQVETVVRPPSAAGL
jgi:hypothetical protein